ncbi:MAG: glycosyltransferase [Candidatus Polarisedimenticolaceae bacterium]|nr:glycosyltransferase [Candidatus Polarisedimenticolaceae bacterium]
MQLIVLGMHRSGTSVLARLLNMMGAYFGPEGISTGANQENPKGFWERRDVRQLNDFVLNSVDCDWDRVADFDQKELPDDVIAEFREKASKIILEVDAHRPWFFKEPRLCVLFKLWRNLFEVPVCIHIYRNPVEVAHSLFTRNNIPIHAGIALWEKYNLSALEASHGLPRFVASYNKLMEDPVSEVEYIYDQLLSCGVDRLRLPSEKEITSFVREEFHHEKASEDKLPQHLNGKQLQLFESFTNGQILKKENGYQLSEASFLILKQYEQNEKEAKGAQDAADKVVVELKKQLEQKEKDLTQQIKQKEQQAKTTKEAANKMEAELKKQLEQKEKDLTQQIKQKEQQAKTAKEAANKMEAELKKQLEQKEKDLTQQIKQKEQEAKTTKEAANKMEAELKKQLEQVRKELMQSKNGIATLRGIALRLIEAVNALLASRRWKLGDFILSLRHKLLLKDVPPIVTDHIHKITCEYEKWLKQHEATLVKKIKKPVKPIEKAHTAKKKPYTPLPDPVLMERINEYKKSKAKKRIVVYTAIFGNYDVLKVPETLNPEYDYVCFTDIPIQGHPVWQFRHATYFHSDTTRIARYYKLHPHTYLKEYDVAVWVDANILIRKDINYLVEAFQQGNKPLGIFTHYQRNCTYSEATACITGSKDEGEVIERQIKRYRLDGLPENKGLPETNMLISKPSDSKTHEIFSLWWKELDNGSKRDQVSVMYALWMNKADFTPLVDSCSKMARFDRESFELFCHNDTVSASHPSVYYVPSFLQKQYNQSTKRWYELLTPTPVTDSILWEFQKKTVDIVIPVHNALDDVRQCFNSVEPTLLDTHRLVIVDDGSEDDTKAFLEEFAAKRTAYVTLIRHDVAKGYTKAANAGMRATKSDYVTLLNSDTIVPPLWLLKLIQCAEAAKEIGIVGPMSNAASWQSIPKIKEKDGSYSVNPLPVGITVSDIDLMCQRHLLPGFPRVQLVNGFCFCIKRAVIERIGLFDEASYPKGYNEENDYCFRTTDAGFDLAIATHVYVYHAKSKSYTPKKRLLLCEESRKVFEKTYGVHRINRATESVRNHPLLNKVRSAIKKELADV